MPRPNKRRLITTTTKTEYQFDGATVLQALRRLQPDIPSNAEIYVPVPGGGCWSHMDLDLTCDAEVCVRFAQTEISEE